MADCIVKALENQHIFAVYFAQNCVIILDRRPACLRLLPCLAQNILAILVLLFKYFNYINKTGGCQHPPVLLLCKQL